MVIVDIVYFSKEDSEAEVIVSDGNYAVKCYAYPVNSVAVNQQIRAIYGFGCSNIVKCDEAKETIQKMPEYYAYRLVAEVADQKEGMAHIGGLSIHLDSYIPNDIQKGDYVSFSVMRLDCLLFL